MSAVLEPVLRGALTAALGQGGGARPLTGDAWASFSDDANGAPGLADSGQAILRDGAATGIVQATISGGALVAGSSGQSTTAAYTGWTLKEDIKSFYAEASLGDANDSVGLIAAQEVSNLEIIESSLHIIFELSQCSIQYWSNSSITTVATVPYTWSANTRRRLGWRLSGNDIYILAPDGVEYGPFTSAAAASRTNHAATFEHYRGATGTPGSKFYAAATNLFASPAAAGRVNMLAQPLDLSNAAWANLNTSITLGQTDSGGGATGQMVLETAVNNSHFLYQSIAKASAAARRYCIRAKVKSVGGRWAFLQPFDGAISDNAYAFYNLGSGTVGSVAGTFSNKTATIYPLGNSWYQLQLESISDTDANIVPVFGAASGDAVTVYLGDVAKGLVLHDLWLIERPI